MRHTVDRDLVERLLQDPSLSYRQIARRANCSDWSVRSIAQQLDGSSHDDSIESRPLTLRERGILGGVIAAMLGGIWWLARRMPPPYGGLR